MKPIAFADSVSIVFPIVFGQPPELMKQHSPLKPDSKAFGAMMVAS